MKFVVNWASHKRRHESPHPNAIKVGKDQWETIFELEVNTLEELEALATLHNENLIVSFLSEPKKITIYDDYVE